MPETQMLLNAKAISALEARTDIMQANITNIYDKLDVIQKDQGDMKVLIVEQGPKIEASLMKVLQTNLALLVPKKNGNGAGKFMAFLEHLTPMQAIVYFVILLVIIGITFGSLKLSDVLGTITQDLGEMKTVINVK